MSKTGTESIELNENINKPKYKRLDSSPADETSRSLSLTVEHTKEEPNVGGPPSGVNGMSGPPPGVNGMGGPPPGVNGMNGPPPGVNGMGGPPPGVNGMSGPPPGVNGMGGPPPGVNGMNGPPPGANGMVGPPGMGGPPPGMKGMVGPPGMGGPPPGVMGMGGPPPGMKGMGGPPPGIMGMGGPPPGMKGMGGPPPGIMGMGGPPPFMDPNYVAVKLPKRQFIIIMISLFISLTLSSLDITIVSSALPAINKEFNSFNNYTWIIVAYLLANTVIQPTTGKLTDIFGRRPMLLVMLTIFTISSAICGIAFDVNMLIAARAAQGIGGGSIISLVNIMVADIVPLRKR